MSWVHITSVCNTHLKKHPKTEEELSSEEKALIKSSRTLRRCQILERSREYTYIQIGGNLGDWWILNDHWKGLDGPDIPDNYSVKGDLKYLPNFPYFQQDPEEEYDSEIFTFSMCLKYLDNSIINGTTDYLKVLNKHGRSFSAAANKAALNELGMNATFTQSADPQDIKEQIKKGLPVAASLLSKGPITRPHKGAHLVVITGYGSDYWVVQDPFGCMDLENGLWSDRGPLSGRNVHYSFKDMNRRLFVSGGATGWCWVNFRKF